MPESPVFGAINISKEDVAELLLSTPSNQFTMELVAGSIDLRPGNTNPPSKSMPGVNWSPKVNWVEEEGGLPDYIRRIAKQLLYRQGMTRQRAIATAINTVKKWCAAGSNESGIHVKPDIRAQACTAVAEWESKKAGARMSMSTPSEDVEEAIMTDAEAFAMFGLIWPEDLPEYWQNPQATDEYLDKMDELFPEIDEPQEELDGSSTEAGSEQRDTESAEQLGEGIDEQQPGPPEVSAEQRRDAGERGGREDAAEREHGAGQAIEPLDGSGQREEPVQDDSEQAAEEQASGRDPSEAETGTQLELATSFSATPWSNFKQSDYDDSQWKKACLIEITGDSAYAKESCKLPVREPSGKLNWNGITAAASRLNQTQAPEAKKRSAARTLVRYYRMAGKEPPENVRKLAGMDLSTETDVAIRAPWDVGDVDKVTSKMYWKQILPKGRMNYQGHAFEWTDENMELAVKNFRSGVFDAVPFVLVNKDDGSHPEQDIEATRGVMLDLQRRSDGLYGLFNVDDRAEMVLSASQGGLGVSPKILFNYYREWDDKVFEGPSIEHIAATFHPRRNGQKPWEMAELSTTTTTENVVDLSGSEYTALDANEGKEGDQQVGGENNGQNGQEVNGTVTTEETNADSQPQVIQLANGQSAQLPEGMMLLSVDEMNRREKLIKESVDQATNRANSVDQRLRASEVAGEISEYEKKGVPFAVLELARPLLLESDEESPKLEYMTLSVTKREDGTEEKDVVKAEGARGEIVRKMLDMYVGTMELSGNGSPSERGSQTTDTEETEEKPDAQAEHDRYMAAYRAKIGEGG